MSSRLHMSPEPDGGTAGGGGPEDDPRFPRIALRSQGLLTLAFGVALGIAFMIFFALLRWSTPTGPVAEFVAHVNPNLWLSFLFGFVGGTVMAGIYNLLVLRRLNLFGLESNLD